jgi:uncharacterized protein (UPF0332 family)
MSQANNKVEWCLKKAKKELETSKKHRGLVKVKPSIEEAKKHIAKAEHNFKAALSFEKTGFSDWSVSAAFYTIYHCLLAIIIKFGYESRNQECTIALTESLKEEGKISLSQEILEAVKAIDTEERHETNVISLRENFQYGTATSIEDKKLEELKNLCRKAIDETKKIIYK